MCYASNEGITKALHILIKPCKNKDKDDLKLMFWISFVWLLFHADHTLFSRSVILLGGDNISSNNDG